MAVDLLACHLCYKFRNYRFLIYFLCARFVFMYESARANKSKMLFFISNHRGQQQTGVRPHKEENQII